jgi:thiopeptide-type bacteriocin biosynthesis protein
VRALAARTDRVVAIGQRLDTLIMAGELAQPKSSLYSSYIHLHCNRLLSGDRLAEEQVLGLLARTRYGLTQAPYSSR